MLSEENRNGKKKTQVYMPSRGMNAYKSDLISDPDVGKAFKYHAQYPGVMQGSQEGKRAKLWDPRAHSGANISLKIVLILSRLELFCFVFTYRVSSTWLGFGIL